jgi:hypothetical protein
MRRFYFRPDIFADDALEAVREIHRLCEVAIKADNNTVGPNIKLLVKEDAATEAWVTGQITEEEMTIQQSCNPDLV